ncbi:ninjurin-1-like [Branchiostoma floridae]|uniref:Ninjurin-1-like n=1 Tax=Branchiostoma floridae TaxID=7739 RepID=A0A9J7NDP8_BRAFL|nr:ninjurin-1-like [Branchiostoma floridae]
MSKDYNANSYASLKSAIESMVDISLVISYIPQLLAITRSPGGVDTGEEIARVVLISICMLFQTVLLCIFVYQGFQPKIQSDTTRGPQVPKESFISNYVAAVLALLVMILNAAIAAVGGNQA